MRLPQILPFVIVILFASPVSANVVLQPVGLNPGDQYRLVFVTSSTRDGASNNINDYNQFVQDAANAAPIVGEWNLSWSAIASTSSVNAIDNTGTPSATSGVAVYRIDGTKVADDYADLWDGNIDAFISTTELGASIEDAVWTGTNRFGETQFPLGSSGPMVGITYGALLEVWSQLATGSTNLHQWPLYAMSEPLTAVPEPSGFLYLSLVGIGFLRRKKYLRF